MKFQFTEYNCGPASVQNALRALGKRNVGQHALAKAAGTTEDGTDEHGVMAALRFAGRPYDEIITKHKDEAWFSLVWNVREGRPVVCCVDRWTHWICVVGCLGNRVVWFDPAKYPYNLSENGVHVASRGKFMRRWKAARKDARDEGHTYYGVVVL